MQDIISPWYNIGGVKKIPMPEFSNDLQSTVPYEQKSAYKAEGKENKSIKT